MGKLVWQKGFKELVDFCQSTDFKIDIFGEGPASANIKRYAEKRGGNLSFHSTLHAPWNKLIPYKIFINPSESEGLCTTTCEAVAMNKWVVLKEHCSNNYFKQFDNVLFYRDQRTFVSMISYAIDNPVPIVSKTALHWESNITLLLEHLSSFDTNKGYKLQCD